MGEKIEETCVTSNGVLGDRVWAVRDEVAAVSEVKKIPRLCSCRRRCGTTEHGSDPAEVTLADE